MSKNLYFIPDYIMEVNSDTGLKLVNLLNEAEVELSGSEVDYYYLLKSTGQNLLTLK